MWWMFVRNYLRDVEWHWELVYSAAAISDRGIAEISRRPSLRRETNDDLNSQSVRSGWKLGLLRIVEVSIMENRWQLELRSLKPGHSRGKYYRVAVLELLRADHGPSQNFWKRSVWHFLSLQCINVEFFLRQWKCMTVLANGTEAERLFF